MTCISGGRLFIGREKASAISTVLSALIIFDMAFLTEHPLPPNLMGVTWARIAFVKTSFLKNREKEPGGSEKQPS